MDKDQTIPILIVESVYFPYQKLKIKIDSNSPLLK